MINALLLYPLRIALGLYPYTKVTSVVKWYAVVYSFVGLALIFFLDFSLVSYSISLASMFILTRISRIWYFCLIALPFHFVLEVYLGTDAAITLSLLFLAYRIRNHE